MLESEFGITSIATPTMVLSLPDELIGLTFNHLDVPTLLRCMQVSKLFHSIISGSTPLVYKIELLISYMEDNEHASMDAVGRLQLLRKYNQAWNKMEWSSSGSIPMSDGHCWELSGGILAQWTQENALSLVQLPSKLKGIPERRWSVPFDFRARDFGLDNSQNLIVLFELIGNFPNMTCNIHLRTFSGEPHPLAGVKHITHASTNMHADCTFLIQVCGRHVGVLFEDQFGNPTPNSFLVWDWRTGDRRLHIYASEFQSFAFMSEDLILAAILRSGSEPTLQVLRVTPLSYTINSVENIPCVCELQYPQVRGSTDYFLIRSEPTPSSKPVHSNVPFYATRREFIFTISLRVLRGDTHESTVLFVPLSTLLSEVERSSAEPGRKVPWDAWGPDGTRMLRREPSEVWVCYTYGMKFIHILPWKGGHEARVYDFNRYAAKRHVKSSVESPTPWKRLAREAKPSGYSQTFREQVLTKLPGRVADVTLEHSDEGWDACMIGEDHIVMVQPQTLTYSYMAM